MPQNSPRGYSYPCFSDTTDFPTQIQDLATDIDTDVQSIIDDIDDARDTPPSVKVTGSVAIPLAAGAEALATYTVEVYDNAAMFPGAGSTLTAPVEGLYLITGLATFTDAVNSGTRMVYVRVNGLIRMVQVRARAGTSGAISVNVAGVHFVPAAGTIDMAVGSSAATSVGDRQLCATRLTGTTIL